MRATSASPRDEQSVVQDGTRPVVLQRTVTEFPGVTPAGVRQSIVPGAAVPNQYTAPNDGVFANLNAKPERGEKTEEQPPVRFSFLYLH